MLFSESVYTLPHYSVPPCSVPHYCDAVLTRSLCISFFYSQIALPPTRIKMGDAAKGAKIYKTKWAQCHVVEKVGMVTHPPYGVPSASSGAQWDVAGP